MGFWQRVREDWKRQQKDKPETSGGRKGWWLLVILGSFIVGYPFFANIFLPRTERQHVIAQQRYQTTQESNVNPPQAEKEDQRREPQPQVQQGRTQERGRGPKQEKEKSAAQKMAEQARLLSAYGGPTSEAWKLIDKAHLKQKNKNQGEDEEPPQTLEIEPERRMAVQKNSNGRRNGHQNGKANGSRNMWNRDFYDRGNGETGILQPPASEYFVARGSVIPVELQDSIDTQTPGQITAKVLRDVYDSVTGRYLMFPYGSVIIGWPDTRLAFDQDRLPTAWDELKLPNGERMSLASFPSADRNGAAGLPIDVNNHTWKRVGRSLLLTLSGGMADFLRRGRGGADYGLQDSFSRESGYELDRSARQLWDRGGHRGPTGTAKAGDQFLVQVTEDMVFPPGDYCERDVRCQHARVD